MDEIWRDIPGYEGIYQVSNLGRVKSLPQTVPFGDLGTLQIEGRIRKPQANPQGNLMVLLTKDGRTRTEVVARIVLRTFEGDPAPGFVVRYRDNDRKNVCLDNLYYASRQEVVEDMKKRCVVGGTKLTAADVATIRNRLQSGEKGSALAKEFNVDPSTISLIKNNKRYRWLT